jgi:DNA-binding NtrC family response regulator
MGGEILVVDDEANLREALVKLLARAGHHVQAVGSAAEARELVRARRLQLVLTDLRLPGADGVSLLRDIKALDPAVEVIVMTAYGTIQTAVEAMREGAYDYVEKPLDQDRLLLVVERALERYALSEENTRLRRAVRTEIEYGGLIGKSAAMAPVYQFIEMVAPSNATVLLTGESGVGKELIARAIHQRSPRCQGPLISLNCGAIPETLLESELFGFEKGAFTGAYAARPGKIELSHGGTLFLDEVAEMSPKTQIDLLRVLETRELRRLGGARLIPVDIRVIAATNKNLAEAVAARTFREDLYYRLNVLPLRVPALRERVEDIPLLAEHFLEEFAETYRRPRKRLSRPALELLSAHPWPGNVRELRNLMERLTVTVEDTVIDPEDLPPEYRPARPPVRTIEVPLGTPLRKVEEMVIRRTLAEVTSHREKAARLLEISPRALHYKLRRYGIETERTPPSS